MDVFLLLRKTESFLYNIFLSSVLYLNISGITSSCIIYSMENPEYEKLINAALRFVSYRPRSEKELTDFLAKKLARWNISGNVLIVKVVNRMRELGYVDDRKFALWWRDQRIDFRPKGKRVIAIELARKGIRRDIIEDMLLEKGVKQPFNEFEGAQKAIKKKRLIWARLPRIEQKKKTYTFLAQRGFSYETIEKIIDELVKKE